MKREYAAACGQRVSIAVRDVTTAKAWPQYDVLIFAGGGGASVTVKASYGIQPMIKMRM